MAEKPLNKRKFFIDFAAGAAWLEVFLLIEATRHVAFPGTYYVYGFVLAALAAFAAQKLRIKGSAQGGWLFVLFFFAALYLASFPLHALSPDDILRAGISRFEDSYQLLRLDGERFKEAYILLASASFTLFGLFFVAVRQIDELKAVRLNTIGQAFVVVFLLTLPSLMLRDEPWWRLGLLAALNGTTLAILAIDPEPLIINYRIDRPSEIQYWQSWLKNRRGNGIIAMIALTIMPLWPVLGEYAFVSALAYVLFGASSASIFLNVSSQLKGSSTDRFLRRLFRIQVQKQVEDYWDQLKQPLGDLHTPPSARRVPFAIGNVPKPPDVGHENG